MNPTPSHPILREFPYRPRHMPMLLVMLCFGACGVVLSIVAHASGAIFDWVMAGLSWAFVLIALIALVAGALRPQRIVFTLGGLILPESRWSKHEREIRLDDILQVEFIQVSGQRFLRIHLPDDAFTLNALMLPNAEAFRALERHLSGVDETAPLPLEPSPAPGPFQLATWHFLAIKLLSLFSFCGAPLYLTDLLKPLLGDPGAFIANFIPLALMLYGTLTLAEDELSGFSLLAIRAGALGALLLATQTAFTILHMLAGPPHPNTTLIVFGMLISALAIGGYAWLWRRRSV